MQSKKQVVDRFVLSSAAHTFDSMCPIVTKRTPGMEKHAGAQVHVDCLRLEPHDQATTGQGRTINLPT